MTVEALGLPDKHFKQLRFLLRAFIPEAIVLAFGSRVTGVNQPLSDIDLVVKNPDNPEQGTEAINRLRIALQESDLPYLVDLYDWSELSQAFRDRVNDNYIEIKL